MPKIKSNMGYLYNLRDDIIKCSARSAAFRHFNEGRIKGFFGKNKGLLEAMDKRLTEIAKKYAIHDAEGKPVIDNSGGVDKYTFVDMSFEELYLKEFNEFMNREVTIET